MKPRSGDRRHAPIDLVINDSIGARRCLIRIARLSLKKWFTYSRVHFFLSRSRYSTFLRSSSANRLVHLSKLNETSAPYPCPGAYARSGHRVLSASVSPTEAWRPFYQSGANVRVSFRRGTTTLSAAAVSTRPSNRACRSAPKKRKPCRVRRTVLRGCFLP